MSVAGLIAIVTGVIALLAFILLLVVGFHAVKLESELKLTDTQTGRHVVAGFVYTVICTVATIVFLVTGVIWIVEQFTT